jgi:hypothetical protein
MAKALIFSKNIQMKYETKISHFKKFSVYVSEIV